MTIPNPGMSFTPFDPLAAAELNKLAANDDSLDTEDTTLLALIAALPQADGWVNPNESWSYSSYDATNKTGVITAPSDATTRYQNGDRFKFTNNGTTQYAIVTKVAATAVTLYFGTDYSLTNSAITANYYSRVKSPLGFPLDPAKWTVTTTSSSDRSTTSTSFATLTDTIVAPIGAWELRLKVALQHNNAGANNRVAKVTLSSDASTETNPNTTVGDRTVIVGNFTHTASSNDLINVTTATTFTMMGKVDGTTDTCAVLGSTVHPTTIRAVCALL